MRRSGTAPSKNFIDANDPANKSSWQNFLGLDIHTFTPLEQKMMNDNGWGPEDIQILRQLKYLGVPEPLKKRK